MIFRLVFLPEDVVFLEARLDTIISIILAAPEIAEREHVCITKDEDARRVAAKFRAGMVLIRAEIEKLFPGRLQEQSS